MSKQQFSKDAIARAIRGIYRYALAAGINDINNLSIGSPISRSPGHVHRGYYVPNDQYRYLTLDEWASAIVGKESCSDL